MLRISFGAALVCCALTQQSSAQTVRTQIPVVTRLVQIYSGYEGQLAEAINHRDTAEINRLVGPDFELRPANQIGAPTARAEWIAESFKEPPAAITIEQMAVHDYGDIRIVSFAMKRKVGTHAERGIAVVDVWKQSGDHSVLNVRYAAVQGAKSQRVPGESQKPQIEKRY